MKRTFAALVVGFIFLVPVIGWSAQPVGTLQSEQVLIASGAQEFVPEGNWAGTDWQTSYPVETVAISLMGSEESWMKDYGND
jgi:hypothetical protein